MGEGGRRQVGGSEEQRRPHPKVEHMPLFRALQLRLWPGITRTSVHYSLYMTRVPVCVFQ